MGNLVLMQVWDNFMDFSVYFNTDFVLATFYVITCTMTMVSLRVTSI